MRIGKLPEGIYNRSVYKTIYKYNKDLDKDREYTEGTVCDADCAFLYKLSGFELSKLSDAKLWEYELSAIVDEVSCGCKLYGISPSLDLHCLLPFEFEELDLRLLIQTIVKSFGQVKAQIGDINVATSKSVNSPQITIYCKPVLNECNNIFLDNGGIKKEKYSSNTEFLIVMFGCAGRAGSKYLANRFGEKLRTRYPDTYVSLMQEQNIREYENNLLDIDVSKRDACKLFEVGEGGLFASLWNVGKAYDLGIEVNLKSVPITQETVEVCDFFDINPYMLYSGGAALMVIPQTLYDEKKDLLDSMDAVLIGRLTDNNDRVVTVSDEKRFLSMPAQDEIYRLLDSLEDKF